MSLQYVSSHGAAIIILSKPKWSLFPLCELFLSFKQQAVFLVLSHCTVSPIPACFCWTVDSSDCREETAALQESDGDQTFLLKILSLSLLIQSIYIIMYLQWARRGSWKAGVLQNPVIQFNQYINKSLFLFVSMTSGSFPNRKTHFAIKYWNLDRDGC